MAKGNEEERGPIDDEPKIYGVHIDDKNHKVFDRRDFIKAASIVGASIALTGCKGMDEKEMADALDKTLQARGNEESSEEDNKEALEPEEEEPTATKNPTKTATEKPTQTSTNTPTEVPTNTEIPTPKGEVTTSHSMFKGPQTNHPFIKKTTLGEEITILGKTEDGVWFKIMDSDGTMGWCYSEFIKVLSSVSIPVIHNPPTPVPTICTCDVYTPCECDSYAPCSCDSHSTNVCTCDEVCTCDTVHYWYPN